MYFNEKYSPTYCKIFTFVIKLSKFSGIVNRAFFIILLGVAILISVNKDVHADLFEPLVLGGDVTGGYGLPTCPANAKQWRGINGSKSCGCTPLAMKSGSIWGGEAFYTDTSSICLAAVHAGVISRSGGNVKLFISPGRSSYRSIKKNGVISNKYGSWAGSYRFYTQPVSNVNSNIQTLNATTKKCSPWGAAAYTKGMNRSCRCDKYGVGNNPRNKVGNKNRVFGSGPYRLYSSNICNSAIHAGVISQAGGIVSLKVERFNNPFYESNKNGITTQFSLPGMAFRFIGDRDRIGFCPKFVDQIKASPYKKNIYTCRCSAKQVRPNYSPVYGNGKPYHTFSNPCLAGRHAGVLGSSGGQVSFKVFSHSRYFSNYPYTFPQTVRNGIRGQGLRIDRNSRNFGQSFEIVGDSFVNTRATNNSGTSNTNQTIDAGIDGVWRTTFNRVVFPKTSSGSIKGTYGNGKGRIIGNLIGRSLTATWVESRSSTKCKYKKNGSYYWGRVRFNFNSDFARFNGTWGRCNNPLTKRWSGTKITGNNTIIGKTPTFGNLNAWSLSYGNLERSGSYIQAAPPSDGNTSYYIAPRTVQGDWRSFSYFSLTLKSWGGKYYKNTTVGDVIISNGGQSMSLDLANNHGKGYRKYTLPLNGSIWKLSGGARSTQDILRNVTSLKIRAEYGGETDYSTLHDVRLLK